MKTNPKLNAFLLNLFQLFQGLQRKQETSQNTPLLLSIEKLHLLNYILITNIFVAKEENYYSVEQGFPNSSVKSSPLRVYSTI